MNFSRIFRGRVLKNLNVEVVVVVGFEYLWHSYPCLCALLTCLHSCHKILLSAVEGKTVAVLEPDSSFPDGRLPYLWPSFCAFYRGEI